MKKKQLFALITAVLLLVLVIGCGAYVGDYYRADETALSAMESSGTVSVTQTENIVLFVPEDPVAGFIFYPGGKVEHTAYAPLMQALAEEGVLCVLIEMPFRLAVLDVNAAAGIPQQFPEVEHWYIGGHSLGGSMAASFLADHPEELDGLVLLASYSTADLTQTGAEVLSLYGSEDGVINMEKYRSYRPNLPENTVETVIQGGNHGQFGSYGPQEGDGAAELSQEEQLRITLDAILSFLRPEQ